MAAVGVEEDPAVLAARILVTLRSRRLVEWPEWVQKDPEPDQAAGEGACFWMLSGRWPKRKRTGIRLRARIWREPNPAAFASVPAPTGSGACSSAAEERERSPAPPRLRERHGRDEVVARRPDSPTYYCASMAGSGPSTSASADRKARPRHAVEVVAVGKARPAVAAPQKERPMKAESPETPLDFGADAAGSGASSSGDDAAGSATPSKRKTPGALGSDVGRGGVCSGDEGCSSPDKLARVGDDGEKKAISEPKALQTPDSDKGVKFEFDLNMPWPEDDVSPGFC